MSTLVEILNLVLNEKKLNTLKFLKINLIKKALLQSLTK